MDDYNVNVLSEAKNEISLRLVSMLTPHILNGIKSIFKESWELCIENDEENKYLMTFQTFLSRVPKWNQQIVDDETKRIIRESKCEYLDDLLTGVHITQLKIMTSIRVTNNRKKIDIEIPKLESFIHRVYIDFARKLYSNVYLFEKNVASLTYQKNMRECELMIHESIMNTVRESIPIENILKSYMDETIDEDVIENIEEIELTEDEIRAKKEDLDKNANETANAEDKDGEKGENEGEKGEEGENDYKKALADAVTDIKVTKKEAMVSDTDKDKSDKSDKGDKIDKNNNSDETGKSEDVIKSKFEQIDNSKTVEDKKDTNGSEITIKLEVDKDAKPDINTKDKTITTTNDKTITPTNDKTITPTNDIIKIKTNPSETPFNTPEVSSLQISKSPPKFKLDDNLKATKLSFSDNDKVLDMGTNKESIVSAPKDIDRLEQISEMRNQQRKIEFQDEDEDEDDNFGGSLKISDKLNIDLGISDLSSM